MGPRPTKRLLLALLAVAAGAVIACSPLPNPNPSSPANQLNGVGSPNQLQNRASPSGG
jgi:hypothetical protein